MDGKNNGKPYEQMDDLGGKTPLFVEGHPSSVPSTPEKGETTEPKITTSTTGFNDFKNKSEGVASLKSTLL